MYVHQVQKQTARLKTGRLLLITIDKIGILVLDIGGSDYVRIFVFLALFRLLLFGIQCC